MDKVIIISLNLFKLEQEIMIIDQEGTHGLALVDFSHLPEVVVEACNVFSTNNIKIIGNRNYAVAISSEINEYAIQNYSNSNLNISILEA